MNNEKLIMKALRELLLSEDIGRRLNLATEITRVLNPSQDVPYEDSLEVCVCGHDKERHEAISWKPMCSQGDCKCKLFVKSSKGEDNG